MGNKKLKCVRCEALGRKQKSKDVHLVDIPTTNDKIPLCSQCILELHNDWLFGDIEEGDYESGSESLD